MYAGNGDTRNLYAGFPELAVGDNELRPCLDCEWQRVSLMNIASGWLGVVQRDYPYTPFVSNRKRQGNRFPYFASIPVLAAVIFTMSTLICMLDFIPIAI